MRRAAAAVLAAAWLSLLPALGLPSFARADEPSNEARDHYRRGVALYNIGEYAHALEELTRANELAPSYNILESLGLVEVQLGDAAAALRFFRGYLSGGKDAISRAQREATEKRMEPLVARVGQVTITTTPPGADVVADEKLVGKAPITEALPLNPGHHVLEVRLTGYRTESRPLEIAAGSKVDVVFALVEATPPRPVEVPPHPVEVPPAPRPLVLPAPHPFVAVPAPSRRVPWLGWALTGATAVGATITGVVALNALSDLHREKNQSPTPGATLDATSSRAKDWALACDLFLAGTLVAGGVSLYFTLKRPLPDSGEVRLGVLPGGASVSGRF